MQDYRAEDYEEAKRRWPDRQEWWWRAAAKNLIPPIPDAPSAEIVELTLGNLTRKWRTKGPFDIFDPRGPQDEGNEGIRRAVAWAAREARARREGRQLMPALVGGGEEMLHD